MPTIQDKTIPQAQNPSRVFLFKEGIFYKASNQGAYLMRDKNYKVKVKKLKNSQNEVLSIGIPITVFEALKKDFAIQDFESYSCFNPKEVFDDDEFQNWYSAILLAHRDNLKAVNQQQSSLEASLVRSLTNTG